VIRSHCLGGGRDVYEGEVIELDDKEAAWKTQQRWVEQVPQTIPPGTYAPQTLAKMIERATEPAPQPTPPSSPPPAQPEQGGAGAPASGTGGSPDPAPPPPAPAAAGSGRGRGN